MNSTTTQTDAYGRTIDSRNASYIRRANAQLSRNHVKGQHSQVAHWGCPAQECIDRATAHLATLRSR